MGREQGAGGIPRRLAQLPRRWLAAGVWEGPAGRRRVALTFDDGPHAELTPRLLDTLDRLAVPASFFVIGQWAERAPELVRRIHAAGHDVGNHTWSHRPLAWGVSPSPVVELARTEALLAELAPGSPGFFRPPYGVVGPGGGAAVRRAGLLPVYWSVLPADWDPLPPEVIRERVLCEAHPGAVVVLHAGHPGHAGTVEALETLVPALHARDYELVTLTELLGEAGWRLPRR